MGLKTEDEFMRRAFKGSELIDKGRARQIGGTLGMTKNDSDKVIRILEQKGKIKRSRRNTLERLF